MRQTVINAATLAGGSPATGVMNANYLDDITFQFNAVGIVAGNGVLTVLGSNDGVNFTQIAFVDPTQANTNAQNLTRITSLTLNASGNKVGILDASFKFEFLKFSVAITTDGTYSVFVHANKKSS